MAHHRARLTEQRLRQPQQPPLHRPAADEQRPNKRGLRKGVPQGRFGVTLPIGGLNGAGQQRNHLIQRRIVHPGAAVGHRHRSVARVALVQPAVQRDLKIAVAAGAFVSLPR